MPGRFRTALRRGVRAALTPDLRDDAGRPFRLDGPAEVRRLADANTELRRLADRLAVLQLAPKRPVERQAAMALVLFLSILLTVAVVVVCSVLLPAWVPIAVAVACLAGALVAALVRRPPQRVEPVLAAALVEEGLCAACGYPLAGVPPSDGLLVCPECGAAWRAERVQRFARVAPEPRERTLWRAALRRHDSAARRYERRHIIDDRGHPRAVIALRQAAAAARVAPEPLRGRIESAIRAARPLGRVRRGLLAAFAGVYAVYFLHSAWVLLSSPVGAWRWGTGLAVLLPVMFFASALAILRSDLGRKAARVRDLILRARLCPVCVADLQGLDPEPDGCVRCRVCASAWTVSHAAAWEPSDGCPHCRYDLGAHTPEANGTIRCPECGGLWQTTGREGEHA